MIQAFELGAVDYITKPFIKNELLARVKTHLTLKQTTDNLKKALLKLQQLSQLDPLTQILNRRSFFEYIENQFNRAIQDQSLFSLLILDLDHFKQINDNYGHLTGDKILINFTLAIQNYLRSSDYFGRYGGEEFVILLPETDQADALKIAQDICDLIAHLSIPTEKGNLNITVSIGVAVFRPQDTRIEDIFDRADQCLYQAKALGRNTCYAQQSQLYFFTLSPGIAKLGIINILIAEDSICGLASSSYSWRNNGFRKFGCSHSRSSYRIIR
ncbi:MAG TPA: hypothetical protein DEF27_11065 [Oscillatoriales bacterium UBA8482]|nr:hypothetical protein [Oscillatoriales bacterium UBA8482]